MAVVVGLTLIAVVGLVFLGILVNSPLTAGLLVGTAALVYGVHTLILSRVARRFQDKWLPWIVDFYEGQLRWALRRRAVIVGGAAGVLVASFLLFGQFNAGVEFFPENIPPTAAIVDWELPVGSRVEAANAVAPRVLAELEGIEGLVHISEMSYTRRVMRPEDIVTPGDEIMVLVKEFDFDRKRISLSIKDAEGDPWQDAEKQFPRGKTVQGRVEKKEGFGIFVNLSPGITGLLPRSKITASDKAAKIETLKPGSSITVTIDSVNMAERKISLGTGEAAEDSNWQSFAGGSSDTMGDLAEKLKQALSKQKNGG